MNDPLGQPTVPTSTDFRLILKFCFGQMDGRTSCVKILITIPPVTLAKWIKNSELPKCRTFVILWVIVSSCQWWPWKISAIKFGNQSLRNIAAA